MSPTKMKFESSAADELSNANNGTKIFFVRNTPTLSLSDEEHWEVPTRQIEIHMKVLGGGNAGVYN